MSKTLPRHAPWRPRPVPGTEWIAGFAENILSGISGPAAHLERTRAVDELHRIIDLVAARAEAAATGTPAPEALAERTMSSALFLMGEAVKLAGERGEALDTLRIGIEMLEGRS